MAKFKVGDIVYYPAQWNMNKAYYFEIHRIIKNNQLGITTERIEDSQNRVGHIAEYDCDFFNNSFVVHPTLHIIEQFNKELKGIING